MLRESFARYKLIIFDMDGTFLDSRRFHARLFYTFFQKHWHRISYERCYEAVGMTVDRLFETVGIPPDRYHEFYLLLDAHYDRESVPLILMTKVVDGFHPFLQWLLAQGIRTALVTNSLSCVVKKIVEYHTLDSSFGDIMGAERDSADKLQRCLSLRNKYRLGSDEILLVGDMESDMALANEMGCDACFSKTGISWYKDSNYIEDVLKPKFVIHDYQEMLPL